MIKINTLLIIFPDSGEDRNCHPRPKTVKSDGASKENVSGSERSSTESGSMASPVHKVSKGRPNAQPTPHSRSAVPVPSPAIISPTVAKGGASECPPPLCSLSHSAEVSLTNTEGKKPEDLYFS